MGLSLHCLNFLCLIALLGNKLLGKILPETFMCFRCKSSLLRSRLARLYIYPIFLEELLARQETGFSLCGKRNGVINLIF